MSAAICCTNMYDIGNSIISESRRTNLFSLRAFDNLSLPVPGWDVIFPFRSNPDP